jgi:hypothetical protein
MKVEDMPQSFRDLWKKRLGERTVEYQWVWEQLPYPSGRILDVGCCETAFAYELAKYGFTVDAIDIREYKFKHENLNSLKKDFFDFKPDKPYDVTIAISTLEHLGLKHYGNTRLYEKGWFRGIQHMYDMTDKYGLVLITMPYGKQTDGFNWVYTPTKQDLFGVEMIHGDVSFTYFANMNGQWKKVSHKIAALKKGLRGGFPQSIVCISIIKPTEWNPKGLYTSDRMDNL